MNSNQEQNNEEIMDVEKTNSEEIKIDEQSIEIEENMSLDGAIIQK
mgnify:CR=1 FL=1